jgi:hypothetical protein
VLREARYQIREQRKAEDRLWQALRKQLLMEQAVFQTLTKAERHQQRWIREAWEQGWVSAWARHRVSIVVRRQEDAQWQTERQQLLAGAFEDFSAEMYNCFWKKKRIARFLHLIVQKNARWRSQYYIESPDFINLYFGIWLSRMAGFLVWVLALVN